METKQIIENIESNLKFDMKVKLECIDEKSFLNVDHTNRYINQIRLYWIHHYVSKRYV